MKKFYSIVLMATALLIGTNMQATSLAKIQQDIDAAINANAGGTVNITLNSDVEIGSADTPIQIYAKKDDKSITVNLDLAGYDIKSAGSDQPNVLIELFKGTLNITGSGNITTAGRSAIKVYGYEDPAKANWSVLNVGKNVKISSTKKEAIGIYGFYAADVKKYIKNESYTGKALDGTSCDLHYFDNNSNYSTITFGNPNSASRIKLVADGKIDYATSYPVYKTSKVGGSGTYKDCYQYSAEYTKAYGVNITIEGELYGHEYGIKMNGTIKYPRESEEDNLPYVHIKDGAIVKCNPSNNEATAIYVSGYGVWLVEGEAEGNIGVYVKSGEITLNNAVITSTSTLPHSDVTGTSSGIVGGEGSAIVVESNKNYCGGQEVTISGDTKVTGNNGYAVEEVITNTVEGDSKVSQIDIQGGTFATGENGEGTMIFTDKTASQDGNVTVYGANVEGNVAIGSENDQLSELLPPNTHITEVVVDGKTTIVVSEGNGPAVKTSVIGAEQFTAVKWQNPSVTEETLTSDLTLTELEINEDYAQTLTIADGSKLIVGRAILGENAKIIVKPGAKLIITGVQGINANVADNIILESSATKQAILLFNPAVASNRHPKAAVNLHVAAGKDGSEYLWTRFALPIQAIDAVKRQNNYDTYIYGWNYTANAGQGDWELVANVKNDLKAWAGYTLTYENEGEQVYTFEGNLAGNEDAALNFVHRGYNYFGNSYSSYIDAKTLVQNLPADIDATVYLWDAVNQIYQPTSMSALIDNPKMLDYEWQKDIAPMTTFILRLMDLDNASADVNYANAIWSNPRHGNAGGSSSAPKHAPAMRNEDAFISMVVTAANGKSDCIRLLESAEYTDAYERGYDAAKFMNTNTVNLYASINGEKYSNVCTNSLDGKEISMQTMDDVNYTISFRNVEGNEYALLDKVANQVIAIEEGAIYEFAAQPNSTIEGRFEIVGRHNMPTAIENTEVKANVKGIYTIMGQYLGEDFEVLPAGVYVVNGVKIVK